MFFIVIQDDVSQSELIGPGLVVRVDPVRLLYLPIENDFLFVVSIRVLLELYRCAAFLTFFDERSIVR